MSSPEPSVPKERAGGASGEAQPWWLGMGESRWGPRAQAVYGFRRKYAAGLIRSWAELHAGLSEIGIRYGVFRIPGTSQRTALIFEKGDGLRMLCSAIELGQEFRLSSMEERLGTFVDEDGSEP